MIIPIPHKSLGAQDLIIDVEDYDLIKNYRWHLNTSSNPHTYYAKSAVYEGSKYIKSINIHRLIMGLGDYKNDPRIVNHINGNGLDNRKCNLEICNFLYNSQSINKRNSKFGCIYQDKSNKRKKRWKLQVFVNGKAYRKRFKTIEEARKRLVCIELKETLKKKNLFPLLHQ